MIGGCTQDPIGVIEHDRRLIPAPTDDVIVVGWKNLRKPFAKKPLPSI